jgi:peptide deformylase
MSNLVKYPNPLLNQKSLDVVDFDQSLLDLFTRMETEMKQEGGLGISAVQVGELKRALIITNSEQEQIKMVNPVLSDLSEETDYRREGCLSLPGLQVPVHRSLDCVVTFRTPENEEKKLALDNMTARVVQHEIDHCNGIILLDKVPNMRKPDAIKKLRQNL